MIKTIKEIKWKTEKFSKHYECKIGSILMSIDILFIAWIIRLTARELIPEHRSTLLGVCWA